MKLFFKLVFLAVFLIFGSNSQARANAEVSKASEWFLAHFGPDAKVPPFSFKYGGKSISQNWKAWKVERHDNKLDANRTEHVIRYLNEAAGLVIRCVAIEYQDFPTIEWTLYFKNSGSKNSPVLADIQALDTDLASNAQGEMILHHHLGSPAKKEDYQPLQKEMKAKSTTRIATSGGRPSNSVLPYFNIEWQGGGVIVVVGWPGQWAADFISDKENTLRVRAGQELTHFNLEPGEEVRTPLIVLQFWKGDRLHAQNVWRRWMLAHSMPRPGGKLPPPQLCACSSHQFGEMIRATETNQMLFIDRYLEEKLKIDYWWMDAGWYVNKTGWVNTGTWEVDTKRFPRGLRSITDHAHARGVKCIVWFEPERVTPGTWLDQHHPEWLLKPPPNPGNQLYQMDWQVLNLGDPAARKWLTDHVDQIISEQGIDLYRQDFNIDPLLYWRAHDGPDRQGITEIRYVTGYLAYWDELRRRHPTMLIDSCASGGRRNDLESMRRAVPLTRSDYLFEPVGEQCHTYGIASWIPYYGTGTLAGPSAIVQSPTKGADAYVFRSDMCPSITACWDLRRKDLDYDKLRRLTDQWRQIRANFLGDYYPLTPYSTAEEVWMAWQWDRPEAAEGVVLAFRRQNSSEASSLLRLHGLRPEARYKLSDLDSGESHEKTGDQLMAEGFNVPVKEKPGAAIWVYKRLP